MAPLLTIVTSRPALSRTLPLVVVIFAFTLTSRPQQTTRFPLVAVIAAFTFTSRTASNVRVVGIPEAVQLTASLTKISPLLPTVPNLLFAVLVPVAV